MRKIFHLIMALSLILVFVVTACAPADQPAPAADPAPAPAADPAPAPAADPAADSPSYTIIEVVMLQGDPWWERSNEGNQLFAAETGHEVVQLGPSRFDGAMQIGVLQDVIVQNPDIIIWHPIDPDASEPLLRQARDQGSVIITLEGPGIENSDYNVEALNNAEYGAYLMDQLAGLMGGEGEFAIMVAGFTSEAHMARAEGAIARQEQNWPDMVLVPGIVEAPDYESSTSVMAELMTAHPDFGGVIAFHSVGPPGAALAVEEAGRIGMVHVVGTSVVSVSRPFLESGALEVITVWDPRDTSRVLNTLAVMVKEGIPIENGMNLGYHGWENITVDGKLITGQAWVDITKENMHEFDF